MTEQDPRLTDLNNVKKTELRIIAKRRARLYPGREAVQNAPANLVGLALSGGGIRSAVTNLGVLYEMSRVGLLRITDYLSTVSGGGYIGCCLASLLSVKDPKSTVLSGKETWSYPHGAQDHSLFSTTWNSFPFRDCPVTDRSDESCPEKDAPRLGGDPAYCRRFTSRDQIFHLRDRASYLIPSSLPFGSHVTRALGAVSASTLLSLLWFFSLVVTLTSLYMFLIFPPQTPSAGQSKMSAPEAAAGLEATNPTGDTPPPSTTINEGGVNGIMKRAGMALAQIRCMLSKQGSGFADLGHKRWLLLALGLVWGCLAPFLMHFRIRYLRDHDRTGEDFECYAGRKGLKCIALSTVALLVVVLLVFFRLAAGPYSYPDPRMLLPVVFSFGNLAGSLLLLCFLAGSGLSWNRRSRAEISLCSGIFVYCLIGSTLFAILPAFILVGNSSFLVLVQAGLILILRFVLAERKKDAGKKKSGALMAKLGSWLIGLLVPLFILLAVVGVACLLRDLLYGGGWPAEANYDEMWRANLVLDVAVALSVLLSLLNFNNISPHVFYKDRLAEAFLATFIRCTRQNTRGNLSQTRQELARNAVEMVLTDLHGNEPGATEECAARGPYLLINATINLTAARDLQGFQRQSENFLLSRCYTGCERTGYLKTAEFKPPLELGRAMTISGAAITSVRGAMGSLAESFACTILGVRLGYWLRNPRQMAGSNKGRKWNWKNLYYELFRYTDSRDSHVYLSDGGHCGDNLGILALLQRRVKLIIVSDAECDPEHVFDSLNNSIRRAYVDYRIKVHISLEDLTLNDKKETNQHYTVGRVLYPDRPWQKSWLLVIKNTMTGRESSPIRNYKQKSPEFPHETTADQFFTEEQFEVYRSLGREACMDIMRHNMEIFRSEDWLADPWSCIDQFCQGIAGKEHHWDDVLRAMWSSEEGDFTTWTGFAESVRCCAEKMFTVSQDDGSAMVEQLKELNGWLTENVHRIPLLPKRFDVPRSWSQYQEISLQVTKHFP